mmetsp:Transcript_3352/g.8775  ORF Transcript_3352/g.8775 Transcript_3352/m.8775 type:complete len:232 (-) Transcript_3352:438-1133(-)
MRDVRARGARTRPTHLVVVAILLGACRLAGSAAKDQCQDVLAKGWCQQKALAGCSRPNIRKHCKLSCGLCPGTPQAALQPQAPFRSQVLNHQQQPREQQQQPASRGQFERPVTQETAPGADSSGAGAMLENSTAGEVAVVDAEPSLTSRVFTFAAGVAIVGAAVSYINSRRRKHRRRTKATTLRDILASDEEEETDDEGPLLGSLGSARYRGNSSSSLASSDGEHAHARSS